VASLRFIPNGLSVARLLLGVAFPFVLAEWRVWVIVAAALSDALDGLAARWLNAESDTGRVLDPVADKVFVLVLVCTLLAEGTLHPLWVLGLAARDVVVLAGVAVVLLRGRWRDARRMPPTLLGKCTTAAQFAVLLVAAARGEVPVWLLVPAVALSLAAAADYARRFPPPAIDPGG
jgi:phosphatidylglycerophosphate synthase